MPRPKLSFIPGNGTNYPEWKETTIGQIGAFHYGKSAPKWSITLTAQTPCVRYGELYTHHKYQVKKIYSYTEIPHSKLVFSKGGEVLVPRVGEEPLDFHKCCFLPFANIAIGEMISIYETKQNGLFISYLFNATMKYEFAKRVEGGNVSNLYYDVLTNIPIRIPCLEEQQKIASFFATLDEKIELSEHKLEALEQLKKGLIQKIFSQEIRFKKDDGSEFPVWKTGLLSDYVKTSGGHTPSMKNREFWNNGKWYWVTSKDMKTDYIRQSKMRVSDKALESLKLYEPKTLLLVARSGILKHSLPLAMLECQATINQDIKALEVSKILPEFLFFYLKNREHFVVKTLVKTGTTVQSLMLEEFYKLTVFEPCMEEQKKIASFFITLDKKIQITSEKIRALKKLKQGFMQQMFV